MDHSKQVKRLIQVHETKEIPSEEALREAISIADTNGKVSVDASEEILHQIQQALKCTGEDSRKINKKGSICSRIQRQIQRNNRNMAVMTTGKALWVDSHRISQLSKLDLHPQTNEHLKQLAASGDLPHLLFYGPSGGGKKTRVNALLREIFGASVEKLKIDTRIFETPSKKIELTLLTSQFHIELNPSDVGIYDRVVVQQLIKEIAKTQQVDTHAARKFKVVVINEADQLSRDAQAALRRTMEKYMSNLRVILICSSSSKIISPIRSRCLLMRIPAFSNEEMRLGIGSIVKKENIKLPESLLKNIIGQSDGNLRMALLRLEATKTKHYPFGDNNNVIEKTDWETHLIATAKLIMEEQTPQRLLMVRGRCYELLSHCIPGNLIRIEIIKYAALYEYRLAGGSKAIFHLEALIAQWMIILKNK